MKHAALIAGFAALSLGFMTVSATAHERGPGKMGGGPRIDFSAADADSDGLLTQEELSAYGAARFAGADSDGSGTLSVQEMEAQIEKGIKERAMEMAGKRAEKGAAHMIARRDANGDGELSLDEVGPKGGEAHIFNRLDRDGDGAISAEEFAKMEGRRGGAGKWCGMQPSE